MSAKSDAQAAKVAAADGIPSPDDPVVTSDGSATNANAKAADTDPDNADTEKAALPKLGTVTVDINESTADLDPRVAAAVKAIKAEKAPEGVVTSVWNIHDPSVYTLTFED